MDQRDDDGTTHGGTDPGASPLDDAETAPQPILTPDLQAAEAAAAAEHHHHHEAPHGHAPAAVPRHAATVVPAEPPPARSWRRTAGVVAAVLLVVGAVSAWALTRSGSTPEAQPGASTSPSATPTSSGPVSGIDPTAAPGITEAAPMLPPGADTLVLGDSLGLTVYPYLADLVPDRYVTYESEVGRTTSGTLSALRRMSSIPDMVIVSSGTNDPTGEVLEADANEILDILGPDRCVVWVDVVRPDSQYAPASQLNTAIDRAAEGRDNVRVLQWTELVATHPGWMGGDGIHPNREGSIGRANAFAAASEACSPFDPTAPTARKQYLPLSVFYGPIAGGGSDPGSDSGSVSAAPTVSVEPSASETPAPAPSPSQSSSSAAPSSPAPTSASPKPTPTKTTAQPTPTDPPPSVAAAPPSPST
ncbi:MAG: hypothetical protein AB7O74_16095 [Candidatus Nanopelagicales bacterium]